MKWLESRVLWGTLLILGGVMFLLQNLGLFEFGDLFWALLLGLAGVFFLSVYLQNRANWWALIPGFTLFGVASLIALTRLAPRLADNWGGSVVLGGIGLAFVAVYLAERSNWWAIIPAGVMLTLAAVAGLDETFAGIETGGIFFLGLGSTFALVALLPSHQGQMRWAWIPAAVLMLMGLLIMAAAEDLIGILWPLVLIVGGGYLILRTFRPRDL